MLLRVAQGLFVGGEWSGAMTIVVENAPLHRRARYAALPQIGSPIGTILSSGGFFLMTIFFSKDKLRRLGLAHPVPWQPSRCCWLPCTFVAASTNPRSSRSSWRSGETEKAPIRTTLKESWKQIIIGMAAGMLGIGGFYLVTAFVVWYGVNVLEYERSLMLLGGIIAAVVEIPVLILGGRLGERFGASKVITYGGIFSAIIAWPAFLLIESGDDAPGPHRYDPCRRGTLLALRRIRYGADRVVPGQDPLHRCGTRPEHRRHDLRISSRWSRPALVAAASNHWWPAAAMLIFLSLFTAVAGVIAPV